MRLLLPGFKNNMVTYRVPIIDYWTKEDLELDDEEMLNSGRADNKKDSFIGFLSIKEYLSDYLESKEENDIIKRELVESFAMNRGFDYELRSYESVYICKIKIPFGHESGMPNFEWIEFFIYGYKIHNNGDSFISSRVDLVDVILNLNFTAGSCKAVDLVDNIFFQFSRYG